MSSKWLFSGALAFELGSWGGLLSNPSLIEGLYLYVVPHAIASVMLAAALWLVLPRRYRFPLPWSPMLLFSLIFFIPVAGAVGVMLGVFPGLYLPRREVEQGWQLTRMPSLPYRAVDEWHSPLFNDGGLQDVLQLAGDSERRLSALLATRAMPGNDAVPVLKLALRDPEDDVRLLAYSMLDQRENRINQHIERLLERQAETPSAGTRAVLAGWYWELAYLGLAQGGVLQHVLQQALEHADAALRSEPSGDLAVLAGRIQIARGQAAEARRYLEQAADLGVGTTRLAPLLAEVAFLEHRYSEVVNQLQRISPAMRAKPPLAATAGYWL
tara:strand:- start:4708 stop:5688 length:981 start_codon:yes stop_codon:yes gene_type:complete